MLLEIVGWWRQGRVELSLKNEYRKPAFGVCFCACPIKVICGSNFSGIEDLKTILSRFKLPQHPLSLRVIPSRIFSFRHNVSEIPIPSFLFLTEF